MTETTGDGSGGVWIRKHTGFVHGVFYDLRSFSGGVHKRRLDRFTQR
jgi:hypothetical protein